MPTGREDSPSPRRLYRDKQNALCCGVCAGIADYFGFDRAATRIVTCIMAFFMPITIMIYIALCILIPKKPEQLYKDEREEVFWRSVRRSPEATFASVRHKFREMEAKMRRMERYVTSSRFHLDREFEDLRNH